MDKTQWIVYQTTNLVNNKIYIGVHRTITSHKFDGYLGSGKLLLKSIKKYGKKNFRRKTLHIFNTFKEAYIKEREIVTLKFVTEKGTYNIMVGGKGNGGGTDHPLYGKHPSEKTKQKLSKATKGKNNPRYGVHLSKETKEKISASKSGNKHHLFGTHLSEKTKRKISIAHGLTSKIIKQRRQDIIDIPKVWGWKTRLAEKWSINISTVSPFISKYAQDIKIECNLIIRQRIIDIVNIPKTRGWKTKLARKWGMTNSPTGRFIKRHAQDLF